MRGPPMGGPPIGGPPRGGKPDAFRDIRRELNDVISDITTAKSVAKSNIAQVVFGEDFTEFWDKYTSCYDLDEIEEEEEGEDGEGEDEDKLFLQQDVGETEANRSAEVEQILADWIDAFVFPESLCEASNIEQWIVAILLNELYEEAVNCGSVGLDFSDTLEVARNDYIIELNSGGGEDVLYAFLAAQLQVLQAEDGDDLDEVSEYEDIELSLKEEYELLCTLVAEIQGIFTP